MAAGSRPQIGFISAFYGAYDDVMGAGFRAKQAQSVAHHLALLRQDFEVVDFGIISSLSAAEAIARAIRDSRIETLVYAPPMVAPPQWLEVALADARCPIIIWSATCTDRLAPQLDHLAATVDTSLVGATMLANCLVRTGRPFVAVDCAAADLIETDRLKRTIRAAVTVCRLGKAVALRIGDPIPGYRDVETSPAELAQLGVRETAIPAAQLEAAFAAVTDGEIRAELERLQTRRNWSLSQANEASSSIRLAISLKRLCMDHGAQLGTVNCHSGWFRQNARIGIVACLGVSLLHEAGIPFSCTGDLPAAIAGLIAKTLSGHSLYCELYIREPATDEFLIAAGGEGDPAWAGDGRIDVVPNNYYPGRCGAGFGLRFALPAGAATLISTTPTDKGWRVIWAAGEITGRSFEKLDGPNGMFRFETRPGARAAEQWIAAGPTHHAALARGRLDVEMSVIEALSGLKTVRV